MIDKCFTICFDKNYIEAALLTAFELMNHEAIPLYLIYIESEGDDEEPLVILQSFELRVKGLGVSFIKIKNNIFGKLDKFHFTNSILYKILIPSIIDHDYIINIDAGTLLGNRFSEYLAEVDFCVMHHYTSDFVMAAFCGSSKVDLPVHLSKYPHNSKYPTGWVLLFDKKNYQSKNLYERTIRMYMAHQNELVWAEQDLLCLLLNGEELQDLPMKNSVLNEQLSIDGLLTNARSAGWGQEFSLYKVSGSLKPWKYWVLDPRKNFYLSRRDALQKYLDLDAYSFIKSCRHSVNHVPIQKLFLEVQEVVARQ